MSEGRLLWEPSAERIERAAMTRYMRERGFEDYHSLWQWSVDELEGFWGSIWDFFGIDATWSTFVTGAVIIIAVAIDQAIKWRRRRTAERRAIRAS